MSATDISHLVGCVLVDWDTDASTVQHPQPSASIRKSFPIESTKLKLWAVFIIFSDSHQWTGLIRHCCSNNSYGGGFLAGCMKVQTTDAEYLSEFKIEKAFSSFTLVFSYC